MLYEKLNQDFILPHLNDNWSEIDFNDFYTDEFRRSYMGLVLDNAGMIDSVYTAVFPSPKILKRLFNENV